METASETSVQGDIVSADAAVISDLFPYRVLVTVERAESLMVCDIVTSDPYVTLSCNEKVIGSTTIVPRNHMKPIWNEKFVFSVVSIRNILMFRIYDDNAHRDDVLMGVIELNLQSAYENGANGTEV